MKILSAAQIRDIDAYTIKHEPIPSIDLMERAAQAFVDWFTQHYWNVPNVKIFCGLGNNGGDGLAVARLLSQMHYTVEVFIVWYSDQTSDDFAANLERIQRHVVPKKIRTVADFQSIDQTDLVIDALFGSGLTRPVEGLAAEVITAINQSKATTIAIDIPSGLFMDAHPPDNAAIIKAARTVTFQLPKLAFLLPQNELYVGDWHVVDIQLHPSAIGQAVTPYFYVTDDLVRSKIRKRPKFSHKGLFGHALLVGGSYGKMGAAVLAAKACLRAGVGLLTVHVPWSGYEIMQVSVPEAMCLTDVEGQHVSEVSDTTKFNTIGIGPGLGTEEITEKGLEKLLQRTNQPMVLDADALNLLARNRGLLNLLPPQSILTPHPKEFERLAGKSDNDFHRLEKLRDFAQKHELIIVLKGAHTAVGLPSGEVYFNIAGNPGMATGGTGDVLTGIITALVAQQYPPADAAMLGVFFHTLAGNHAAEQKGYAGLIASDLIDFLPAAFADFGM